MRFKGEILASLGLASLIMSSGVLAHGYKGEVMQPAPTCLATRFDGFYLGGNLGMVNNDFSFHDNVGHTIDLGEFSPLVELFGGYRWPFSSEYSLAGEIFANSTLGDASVNTTVVDGGGTHVRVKTQYSYGLALLPGMMLNERTLGFLRFGAVGTRFESKVQDPPLGTSNNNITRAGFQLGLGVETSIFCNFDLRLEYLHTFYKSFTTSLNSYNIHPSSDRANIGLVYKFG